MNIVILDRHQFNFVKTHIIAYGGSMSEWLMRCFDFYESKKYISPTLWGLRHWQ